MTRVDSHQHFWKVDRGDYGWLTAELGVLYKDYHPEDILPLLGVTNIDKTIVVQAAETVEETKYLLSLADEHDFIAGVVGWVDMESEGCVSDLEELVKHSKFKGIRPMIQDIKDKNWMLKPELEHALKKVEALGLCFDALVKPPHLEALQEFVVRYPTLKIVIDHGAKPNITGEEFSDWAVAMKKLSEADNVYCKISGLLTEAKQGARAEDLNLWVNHLVDCFGADRLMWGSDWPVLKLANDYENWSNMAEEMLSDLSEHDKACIFGNTAYAFYNL
jgi:L-fuconolactonase